MATDLLSIDALSAGLSEKQLRYLSSAIPEHHRCGVGNFVLAQRKLFNDHAADLAVVLAAIATAPKEYNLKFFEQSFIEWLRDNGVSSSRITQLKGAVRIKSRVLAEDSFYSQPEKDIVQHLEVEKAYIFGRLTFAGQREAFGLHYAYGTVNLQQMRQLLKRHQYDPKSQWQGNDDWKPSQKGEVGTSASSVPFKPSMPLSTKAHDLALTLQAVVDELLDIKPQWEGDQRVIELVDAQRLSDLTNQLCAGRDLGWDF
jgi:hypothetical protein